MATYIDQRDAAITAIQALIAPNGVGAITGQVHQDNEVGQTEDAYLNLFAYDNFGFVIVRTGIDPVTGNEVNTAAQNGANLIAAYAAASALTPNGQPLSATNRAAVLVPPGVYSFGAGKLTMNTQFVDIIGLGAPESIVITSQYAVNDGTGTITKTCDNAIIKNVTISNGAAWSGDTGLLDASGFAPQGVYNEEVIENVIFYSANGANPYMRQDVEYAGTYINCKVDRQGSNIWIMFAGATGVFKGCDAKNDYGFGFAFNPTLAALNTSGFFEDCFCFVGFGFYQPGHSGSINGTFKNCTALSGSFGQAGGTAITGTFINCKSGDNSFGAYSSSSLLENYGQYFNCIGGNSCFSGFSVGGNFNNCSAGQNSFCGYQNIFSGTFFRNCNSGVSSFLSSTNENDGFFYDCKADTSSFCAPNGSINGYFENCTCTGRAFFALNLNSGVYRNCFAEFDSFSGADIDGTFFNCEAGGSSFNADLAVGTNDGVYSNCSAGAFSFNGKNIQGTYERCSAGDQSFGYSTGSSNPIIFTAAKFSYCKGGNFCFGVSAWMDAASEFKYCEGGNLCFGVNNGGAGQYIRSKFYNCVAGNFSFATGVQGPRGTGPGDPITAEFHNCVGGNFCFGSGGGIEMAGLCVNCKAGTWSFGASQSNGAGQWAEASGRFYNCVGGNNCFGASSGSNGGAVASGQFHNCWAGTGSFGSNSAAPASGDISYASGYFVDCSGGSFSFAGHTSAYKNGKFIRCIINGDGGIGIAANDEGPLVENGLMEDCTWVISGPLEPALLLGNINNPLAPGDEPPKIYGGKYIAGAGAGRSIEMINIGTATPVASIVQIRANVSIDGAINNLASAGALDAEGNYIYSGL